MLPPKQTIDGYRISYGDNYFLNCGKCNQPALMVYLAECNETSCKNMIKTKNGIQQCWGNICTGCGEEWTASREGLRHRCKFKGRRYKEKIVEINEQKEEDENTNNNIVDIDLLQREKKEQEKEQEEEQEKEQKEEDDENDKRGQSLNNNNNGNVFIDLNHNNNNNTFIDLTSNTHNRNKRNNSYMFKSCNEWSTEEVLQWLIHSGYEHYARIVRGQFYYEEVDGKCLKLMDIEDLRHFGIQNFFDGKMILRNIEKLM